MKKLVSLLYGVPVVLFFFATIMNMAVTTTGETVYGSTLLDSELFVFGTMMSPIFIYLLFAILGIVMITGFKDGVKTLGKGIYSVAMVSSFLIYRSVGIEVGIISQDTTAATNNMGSGAFLLLFSAIIGLIIVAVFIFTPIIKEILDVFYSPSSASSFGKSKAQKNPFEDLRNWKLLADENVISDEEYVEVKEDVLDNMKFKKSSKIESIHLLKEIENEGLITKEDFSRMKKELI